MVKDTGEVIVNKPNEELPKIFTFDSVYDWNIEQESIFTDLAYPIIDFCL